MGRGKKKPFAEPIEASFDAPVRSTGSLAVCTMLCRLAGFIKNWLI